MTREELLLHMAKETARNLSKADAAFVCTVGLREPERMMALLNTGAGREFTGPEFAAFALACAKRIAAGPTA